MEEALGVADRHTLKYAALHRSALESLKPVAPIAAAPAAATSSALDRARASKRNSQGDVQLVPTGATPATAPAKWVWEEEQIPDVRAAETEISDAAFLQI